MGGQKKTATRLRNKSGQTENKNDSKINRYSFLSDSDEDNEVSKASQARTPHNQNKRSQTGNAQTKQHVNPPRLEKSRRPMNMGTDTLNADSSQPNERRVDSSRRGKRNHPTSTGLDPLNANRNQLRTAILGVSMLKHLNTKRMQAGLQDQKVTIKTYPEAGIEEIKHYIVPTLHGYKLR